MRRAAAWCWMSSPLYRSGSWIQRTYPPSGRVTRVPAGKVRSTSSLVACTDRHNATRSFFRCFSKRAGFEELRKRQLRQASIRHIPEAFSPFPFRFPAAGLNPAEIEARRNVMGERRTLQHDAVRIECLQCARPRAVENQLTEEVRLDERDAVFCGKPDNRGLDRIRHAAAQRVMA